MRYISYNPGVYVFAHPISDTVSPYPSVAQLEPLEPQHFQAPVIDTFLFERESPIPNMEFREAQSILFQIGAPSLMFVYHIHPDYPQAKAIAFGEYMKALAAYS